MTHITQSQAVELAKKHGHWSGETVELNDVGISQFANAAIDYYIEQSVSELTGTAYKMPLSAELPEPDSYKVDTDDNQFFTEFEEETVDAATNDDANVTPLFTYNQLIQALASRDAKWQGFEIDYLAKCKELDILQAERDAALEKLEAEQALKRGDVGKDLK